MTDEEAGAIRARIEELRLEHRDLDDVIDKLVKNNVYIDQLQLRRLKKRKYQLKTMIARLEDMLIPDLDA